MMREWAREGRPVVTSGIQTAPDVHPVHQGQWSPRHRDHNTVECPNRIAGVSVGQRRTTAEFVRNRESM